MSLESRICALLFSFTAAAILGLAILCSVAVASGAPQSVRLPFRLICHGNPARCLTAAGVPMPICARCTGIYLGALSGIALFAAVPRIRRTRIALPLLALIVAPLAVDGLTQAAGLRESTNLLRLTTGFPAAAAFLLWALTHIEAGARRRDPSAFRSAEDDAEPAEAKMFTDS